MISDKQTDIDFIVKNIINYSQINNDLLHKYNLQFFIQIFDRNMIVDIAENIQAHQKLTLQQFIRILLLKIKHSQNQTLYLAIGIKRFYDSIIERTSNQTFIQLADLTTFLCQKISKEDMQVILPHKKIQKQQINHLNKDMQQLENSVPIVISKIKKQPPKINIQNNRKNKKLQQKKGVSKLIYSYQAQKLIAFGTLSSSIAIYDKEIQDKFDLKSKQAKKIDKDIGIMSIAFCQRNCRLGAIMTNGTIVFWQGFQDFQSQKVVHNKFFGQKIYYLQVENSWVTVNKNTIFFWDLKQQVIIDTITCLDCLSITDVCQITHLNAICISMVTFKQEKSLQIYQRGRKKAKIQLNSIGCHTLHENKVTQSLIAIGYSNLLPIYTVQGDEFDVQLKFTLQGHKTLITCVDSMQGSTLIMTGDDSGEIRIWDLTYMRCIQFMKISNFVSNIKFLKNKLYYTDQRINMIPLDGFQVEQGDKQKAIYQFYDSYEEILWIITTKDVRKIDFTTGKIKAIYILCDDSSQITAAIKVTDGFIVGDSEGYLFHYDSDCNVRFQKQIFTTEVRFLYYDNLNKLISALNSQGKLLLLPENMGGQIKTIIYQHSQIDYVGLSSKQTTLVMNQSMSPCFSVWNYQNLKLLEVIQVQTAISSLYICPFLNLISVCSCNNILRLMKFHKRQQHADFQIILQLNLKQLQFLEQVFKQKQQVTDAMNIVKRGQQYFFLCSTNLGYIFNIQITQLVKQYFSLPLKISQQYQQAGNINKVQNEFYQQNFRLLRHSRKISQINKLNNNQNIYHRFMWIKKLTNDPIKFQQNISVKEGNIALISNQWSKLISITKGNIDCSLSINKTYPIKWNTHKDYHSLLIQQIKIVLEAINSILSNKGYQMLLKEYKNINVSNFMTMIQTNIFPIQKYPHEIERRSFKKAQINAKVQRMIQPSLKTLQAYKRINMIKKMSQQSMYNPLNYSIPSKLPYLQFEQFINFFAQQSNISKDLLNSKLLQSNLSNKLSKCIFPQKDQLKKPDSKHSQYKRQTSKQNSKDFLKIKLNQSILSNLSNTQSVRSRLSLKSKIFEQKCQNKKVKDILNELNDKLKTCRMKYSKKITL